MLIKDSLVIRRARCLEVVAETSCLDDVHDKQQLVSHICAVDPADAYHRAFMLIPAQMNPIFGGPLWHFGEAVNFNFDVTDSSPSTLGESLAQYISEPRICVVYLEATSRTFHRGWCARHTVAQCSMRVSTGITIKDLLEGVRLLRKSCTSDHRVFLTSRVTVPCDEHAIIKSG